MQTMRPDGDLGLRDLIALFPPNYTIAEIGSYAGESTAYFAAKADKVYAIDPWIDYVDTSTLAPSAPNCLVMTGVEEEFDKVVLKHPNIVKMKAPSHYASGWIENRSLDVVYLDGNHDYEHVCQDIALWFPKIKSGGIISGHDWGYIDVVHGVTKILCSRPHKVFADNSWMFWLS